MGAYDDLIPGNTAVGPYDDLIPTDEEPEVVATEGGGGFLEKINAALRKPSPAWLQAPEQAARELITEQLPHDLPSYLKSIGGPVVQGYEQAKAIAGGDVSGLPLVGRVPEIIAADETPAFSKDRYKTALKTLMDVGALAGAVEGPRIPLRAEPTLAERITQPRVEPVVPPEPPPAPPEAPVQDVPVNAPEAVVPSPVAETPVKQAYDALSKQHSEAVGRLQDAERTGTATEEMYSAVSEAEKKVIAAEDALEKSGWQQGVNPEGDWDYLPQGTPQAAPPAPVPVSPGAAKQLGKLKAYVEKSKKLGQQVDPKVEAKIAEIEGVPLEAPVQAQEAPSFASEAPGGVPVAETPVEPPPPGAGAPPRLPSKATDFTEEQFATLADEFQAARKEANKIRSWPAYKMRIGEEVAAERLQRFSELRDTFERIGGFKDTRIHEGATGRLDSQQITERTVDAAWARKFHRKQVASEPPPSPPPPEVPPAERGYAGMEPVAPPVQTEVPGMVGISEARTEVELGPGSVVPGAGAEMGSGLAYGREYVNKGGDPRLPIRRANTSGMVGKNDVGIVHAELDRLRVERNKAAAALEANPGDPVLQQAFSVADDAQRAWRKELQPVLTKASDALREAHAASVPDADVGTYQGLADLMDEHFKGERTLSPEERTALAKAAKGVKESRNIANGEMAKVEDTLTKQVRARGKKVMSPEELDMDLKGELETIFKDCILGA